MKRTCYMCHRRPRKLTAERDGGVYKNAVDVVMFCSLKCAANYGLLWGAPSIRDNEHFCQATGQWRPSPADSCEECREDYVDPPKPPRKGRL